MELIIPILLFVIGLLVIIKGGDLFVDSATWIAKTTGIPSFIIGATIVSFATTLPELLVSVFASLSGMPDMAIGNVVGSAIVNISFILAISLVVSAKAVNRRELLITGSIMLAATIVLALSSYTGVMSTFGAIILFLILIGYIAYNIYSMKEAEEEANKVAVDKKIWARKIIIFIIGAIGVVIGSQLLVNNGSAIASMVGISERIIGLTIVAIGTSLPELVTTITALKKNDTGISVGNIFGANIINLTFVLSTCSFLSSGLVVDPVSVFSDMPIIILVGLIAIVPPMFTKKFMRWQGFVLLIVYFSYLFIFVF
ncbi:MAG: calcium/sodium antiporter [Erysipelotrichaceae bacterium]